jgi:hypothetical protein
MKEHLFFIETSLHPVASHYMEEADLLKRSLEEMMLETLIFANGAISQEAIDSKELVTQYTLPAEEVTSKLTGSSIDSSITNYELNLVNNPQFEYTEVLEKWVENLNVRSLNLLREVIEFKEKLLFNVLECKVFIEMYPHMLEHLIREANLYLDILVCLQERKLPDYTICQELGFWNHIMEDHAEFIDGMLDPEEKGLKEIAEKFANEFEKLIEECIKDTENKIIAKSLKTTEEIKDFKKDATIGLIECNIRSIIPPLLADHVLREAYHYIRLLKMMK